MTTMIEPLSEPFKVESFSFIELIETSTTSYQSECIHLQTLEIITLDVNESTQKVYDILESDDRLVKEEIVPSEEGFSSIFVYKIIKDDSSFFLFDSQKLLSVSMYVTVKNTGIELWLCGINDHPHRNDVEINHQLLGIDIDSLNDSMDIVQLDNIEQLIEVIDQILNEFDKVLRELD